MPERVLNLIEFGSSPRSAEYDKLIEWLKANHIDPSVVPLESQVRVFDKTIEHECLEFSSEGLNKFQRSTPLKANLEEFGL
jgi:hypothetical protein